MGHALSRNDEVASALYRIAQILELQGVAFKPRAYQRAAENIESSGDDVAKLVAEERLGEIAGVGKAIQAKVRELVETGRLEYLAKLEAELPAGLLEILQIPGLGPKKAASLHAALPVGGIEELRLAAVDGRVQSIAGFGKKSEAELIKSIDRMATLPSRFPRGTVLEVAGELMQAIEACGLAGRIEFAGSLRRGRDHVGDLDLLVSAGTATAPEIMSVLLGFRRTKDILAQGETKTSVRLDDGLQVDLRVLEPQHFGAAWMYFTGSKDHNVALRARAQARGWTLNEYALTNVSDGSVIASETEQEIFAALDLDWVPPEIRENRGELNLAQNRALPRLLQRQDLAADLHTHTTWSDGRDSLADMVAEGARLGYRVYGVSDHSAGLGIAQGLDGPRFAAQQKVIQAVRAEFPDMTILQGSEMDIRKDGDIDLDAQVRRELDYVVGSVHSAFTLDPVQQTKRILRAIDSGIDVLGHPTGRLMGQRPSIDFDFEEVAEACAERGVLLEINAAPGRLDLWGEMIRTARSLGCRFAISSDAHAVHQLGVMPHGVTQARRGGLTRQDVATTETPKQLLRHLGHSKRK